MFRLFRATKGRPYTLFHPVNGSRQLPLDEWVTAEQKTVYDGSRGKLYRSGFHVMPTMPDINKLLRLFKKLDDLVIVEVEVDGETWPKAHSRFNIQLAERMLIPARAWERRVYVKDENCMH